MLLLFPEALAGPSFQLSFAAVAAIVALHEHPRVKAWFAPREQLWWQKFGRTLLSLLLTGVVVELSLIPIALFHFHKAGIYGAVANIVAIPLTTFIVMPLEALALFFDLAGIGAPAVVADGAVDRSAAVDRACDREHPGSVAALPAMPGGAFGLMAFGGLWVALWRTRWRRLGGVPFAMGAAWALVTPAPDLLVTGDGRHVAIRTARGGLALLRERVGDYTSDMLAENSGVDGEPLFLSDQPEARCSRDLCLVERKTGGRTWRILATRSAYLVPAGELIAACATADIVVSERWLPEGCRPRWLRLDRDMLAKTGGVAVTLRTGHVATVLQPGDRHPWRVVAPVPVRRSGGAGRRAYPARAPDVGNNAADRTPGSPDRGGSSPLPSGNI